MVHFFFLVGHDKENIFNLPIWIGKTSDDIIFPVF